MPLVSMSVSTLERCMYALREHNFSEVLEDRIKAHEKLGAPFEAVSSFVSRGAARKVFKHVEILKVLSKEVIDDFGMLDD